MDDEPQADLEKVKRLNDVFSKNPQLASHVRELGLRVKDSSDLWDPCFEDRNFMEFMAHMSQSGIGQQPPHLELGLSANRPRFKVKLLQKSTGYPGAVHSRFTFFLS